MIKFAIFDFDGVFSDKVYISDNNSIIKSYNPKDVYSLKFLNNNNIKIGIITGCNSNVINFMEKIKSRVDIISTNNYNKKEQIIKWSNEFNIDLKNISYMGDDLFDAEAFEIVGLSGCPQDAVKECKEKAHFICKNKGGDGAVREFVEHIIEHNKYSEYLLSEEHINLRKNGKITAIIPVRSGSTRCKNKNIRQFGDTNLLKRKIEILKQVPEIDEILVSSNCDEMLRIANEMNVKIDKRPEIYANSDTPGYLFYEYISKKISNPIFMYVHAVCPFVSIENLKTMINLFRNNIEYDSVNSSYLIKHFMWMNNKPLNYNNDKILISQLLPDIYIPTFCPMILLTKFVQKNKTLIGNKPYFYELSQIEGIDIDTPYDFEVSELLYKNCFFNNNDIVNYLERVDNIKTEFLDCTIRDGGYINNWNFTDESVLECYKSVSESGYDYFEIGFMNNDKTKGKYYNLTEQNINDIYKLYNGCKIAVMISLEDNDFKLSSKNKTSIDLIRLHVRLIENDIASNKNLNIINKTLNAIEYINNLGYEVCINLSSSDKYDINFIEFVLKYFSNTKLKCVYLADTFGSLNEETTRKQLYNFQKTLYKYNSNIPLGFHPHNNMGNALAKSKVALDFKVHMLDSSILGLGRGAGNLQSELLIMELNVKYHKFKLEPVLYFGSKFIRNHNDKFEKSKYVYNNSILYALTAYMGIHPDYVNYILNKYNNLEIIDIYKLFIKIKELNILMFDKKIIDDLIKLN